MLRLRISSDPIRNVVQRAKAVKEAVGVDLNSEFDQIVASFV
jgi:hypothetical protein